MSDVNDEPQETQEPKPEPQPERISYDPDGNRYIRTDPNGDEQPPLPAKIELLKTSVNVRLTYIFTAFKKCFIFAV